MGLVAEEMRNSEFKRVAGLDFRPLCNESSNGRALPTEDLVSMSKAREEGAS
jgi:hypothetical protein